METTIGFREEGLDRLGSKVKGINDANIQAQQEDLRLTLEIARAKSSSDKEFIRNVDRRMQAKRSELEIDRLSQEGDTRRIREQNIQSLGPNASQADILKVNQEADGDIDAIRQGNEYQKRSLEIQEKQLEVLREAGKQGSLTSGGRRAAQGVDLHDSDQFDSYGAASTRIAGLGGGGGVGKMLGGVIGKFAAVLAPLALMGAALSYAKADRQALAGAQTGEGYLIEKEKNLWNTLSFGFGAGDWISAGKQRSLQARNDWTRESADVYGMTGTYGKRMGWGTSFGMTSTQLSGDYKKLAEATLDPTADLKSVIAGRKAFGLQGGQSMTLASMGLADESSYLRTMGMLTGSVDSGAIDRIRVGGLMNAVNQTSQAQMQLGGTDTSENMRMALALSSVGGGFGDARLSQRMTSMNQALTNPSNDFQKANTYQLLRGLDGMKDASWTDLEIAREKGMGQKGFLNAVMTDAVARGGGKDGSVQNIKSRLGLSTTDSAALYEKFKSNPELFEKMGEFDNEEDAQKWMKSQGMMATSKLDKEKAVIDEAFITSAKAGMAAVERIAQILEADKANIIDTSSGEFTQGANVDNARGGSWVQAFIIGLSQQK